MGGDTVAVGNGGLVYVDLRKKIAVSCKNQESESGDGKVKAIKMLDYLDEYTNFHFQAEEELQKKVSYPELAKHQEKHDEFKKSIQELYDFLNENEGPNEQFIEQVKINVVDWLFKHIKTFDRSVAEYIHLNNNAERL